MKPTRNLWPFGILSAFALFIAGTAGLIVLACSHKVDLVSADYYEQEIRFQSQLDRLDRTHKLEQQACVSYDASAQRITISVPVQQAVHSISGQVQLYRPSAAGLDRHVKLAPDSRGFQSVDAAKLLPGLWKVRVLWTVENKEYFIDQSVIVRAGRS